MKKLTGIGVSRGVATGRVVRLPDPIPEPLPRTVADPAFEKSLIKTAVATVVNDLEARLARANDGAKEVLEATIMMVSDPALIDDSETVVMAESTTAARAFWVVASRFAEMLAEAGGYMGERANDVKDVRDRVVATLLGLPMPEVPDHGEPYILVAHDLAPADTAVLPLNKVLALVTSAGGPTSHTAIIARAMNLPAVVACKGAEKLKDDEIVVVDGGSGVVVSSPDAELVAKAQDRAASRKTNKVSPPIKTADGVEVALFANVANGEEARKAREVGATGVGLFRTELLFLDRVIAPSIDEQASAYREVFDAFEGMKVVVRTLDAGADKPLPFLDFGQEWNPALGVRGLRTALRRPEVLTNQLQAIALAAKDSRADVWVMAPMVSTPAETIDFVEQVHAAGLSTAGVMVEVPSAAVLASKIIRRAAFASIGTNDLCQYVHAADRQSADLADLNNPWQPGLLHLVDITVRGGRDHHKPVGVCGEAAADPMLACVLLGLGVSTLSMSAAAIPDVAAMVSSVSLKTMQKAALAALEANTVDEAKAAAAEFLPVPDDSFLTAH